MIVNYFFYGISNRLLPACPPKLEERRRVFAARKLWSGSKSRIARSFLPHNDKASFAIALAKANFAFQQHSLS